jgi:hypothetical protein
MLVPEEDVEEAKTPEGFKVKRTISRSKSISSLNEKEEEEVSRGGLPVHHIALKLVAKHIMILRRRNIFISTQKHVVEINKKVDF